LAWLPTVVRGGQGASASAAALLGTFGPSFAAALVTRSDRAGRADLRARTVAWQAPIHVYATALLVPPVVAEASARVAGRLLDRPGGSSPRALARTLAFASSAGLLGGPVGEEPGWRGFALPRVEARLGRPGGSLVLGLLWGAWHLPLLIAVPEQRLGASTRGYLPAFAVVTCGHSAFQSLLAALSAGSVPVAVLGHSAFNASTLVLLAEGHSKLLHAGPDTDRAVRVFAGGWATAGLLCLIAAELQERRAPGAGDRERPAVGGGSTRPRSRLRWSSGR